MTSVGPEYPPPPDPAKPANVQQAPPGYGGPPPGGPPPAYAPPPAGNWATTNHPPGGTTVVVNAPGGFRDMPATMQCPYCSATVVTAMRYEVGGMVILISILLFIFGFWICAFIPCCIDSLKDVYHYCPNCHNQLGVYRRM